ncbi:hypothetical protein MFRU_036g00470 [Monilinia fructicola]|nr:hypothetical protein MFRU_036g00470 [Monilinia fructicola]
MFTLPLNKLMLVAGGLSTLSLGAPLHSHSFIQERTAGVSYKVYSGDGDTNVGWPAQSAWVSDFETMFANSVDILKSSCSQFGVGNNSDDEIANLKSAIQEVESSTGVDGRYIFAIIIQESSGCVRVPTTVYSISNPGLMQSHAGTGSCNRDGNVQDPCPKSEMVQMITDGVAGTSTGDGLKQCIAKTGVSDVSKYYKAARIYNSGSIASTGNLGQGVATHCYASDVANRLSGWYSIASPCDASTIGSLDGSPVSSGSASSTSEAGGVYVEFPTTSSSVAAATTTSAVYVPAETSSTPVATTSIASTHIAYTTIASTPIASSTPIFSSSVPATLSTPTPSSITITTATPIISTPAFVKSSSATSTASPTSTSTTISYPSTSPNSTSPNSTSTTTYTPGSSCSTDGQWNCIDGNTFQRCSSGVWSTVGGLAAGIECKVGEGITINTYQSTGAYRRHADARAVRGLKHGHARALIREVLES